MMLVSLAILPKGRRMQPIIAGQAAPVFSLPGADGTPISLIDFLGRKLVIFFYPKANTDACTREAIDFSSAKAAFTAAGTALLGVSHDPIEKQRKFVTKHGLTTSIASDERLDMLNAYGVWGEKSMYGRVYLGIERTTVLVDSDGVIARVWSRVRVANHVAAEAS
jgi:thioredoxin-dependent peroxiredoxin